MTIGDKVEYRYKYWEVKNIVGTQVLLAAYQQPDTLVHKEDINVL